MGLEPESTPANRRYALKPRGDTGHGAPRFRVGAHGVVPRPSVIICRSVWNDKGEVSTRPSYARNESSRSGDWDNCTSTDKNAVSMIPITPNQATEKKCTTFVSENSARKGCRIVVNLNSGKMF